MMHEDEIMSELRQIRAEMMEEFGGDRDALYRYLKTIEVEEARKGRIVVSRPPRRPEGYKPEAA